MFTPKENRIPFSWKDFLNINIEDINNKHFLI